MCLLRVRSYLKVLELPLLESSCHLSAVALNSSNSVYPALQASYPTDEKPQQVGLLVTSLRI